MRRFAISAMSPSEPRRAPYRHRVYGIAVESDVELASLEICTASTAEPAITLTVGSADRFKAVTQGLIFDPQHWFQQIVLWDGALYVRGEGLLEFVVSKDGRRIDWRKLGEAEPVSFEAYLLNFALSAALLQQGEEPLHATVVDYSGRAVGLLGDSGAGKSTLAAFLIAHGGELLTDDMLRVTFDSAGVVAHAGPDRLKLFAEPARRYLPDAVGQGHFNPLSGKIMFQPTDTCRRRHDPRPLCALFHLREGTEVSLTRALGAGLVRTIISSTMNTRLDTPARLAQQFTFAERLARTVPVFELSYPRAYAVLDQVADKIREAIGL